MRIRIYFYTGSLEYFQKAKWWKPDELRSSRPVLRGAEAEMPRSTHPYIKVKGVWNYLYRAVDKEGNTIDFMLSKHRDEASAKAFFTKAIESNGLPEKITIDKSGANTPHAGILTYFPHKHITSRIPSPINAKKLG